MSLAVHRTPGIAPRYRPGHDEESVEAVVKALRVTGTTETPVADAALWALANLGGSNPRSQFATLGSAAVALAAMRLYPNVHIVQEHACAALTRVPWGSQSAWLLRSRHNTVPSSEARNVIH